MISRRLRFWARLCLAAMLLATLAPGISRTLAASRAAGDWVEVCSGAGMRWVQVGAPETAPSPLDSKGLQRMLDRCGHCTLAGDRWAPLIPALPVFVGDAAPVVSPEHTESLDVSLGAWRPCARGPPLLS